MIHFLFLFGGTSSSTLSKVFGGSQRKPCALESTDAADIVFCGKDQFVVHDGLSLLAKEGRRWMNAHGQTSQDAFVSRVGLQQSRVLEEAGEEALQDNLQIMTTGFLGVDRVGAGGVTGPFTELDQLFPDIEHMAHMTGIDKVFPAPVPVALDGFVGAKGVEEREMVAIDRSEFLTSLVGLLAFGGGG